MKVLYSRVSSQSQNEERQIQNTDGFDYVLVDKCSGLIPFWERPQGSQIKKLIDSNLFIGFENGWFICRCQDFIVGRNLNL